MPLSRYEIGSEYSLANPDLYRVADKDDPEGLLEGVAMAGLVGIIRQLGDLAEFAAEVFHDLHEDVLATAARGHVLLMRVRQLETEVPLIEDMMLTKNNHGNPMYDPGLEWHPHIRNDQNHFTQGDLPRFIRSAYEDCRSPPRLFPLDRYDAAGAGACLKRFSDPSFFKMEWASSELMKAEKEQRDQKARRMKKKGRRQGNREVREARLASHIQLRAQTEVENMETQSISSSTSDLSLGFNQETADSFQQESNDMLSASGLFSPEQEGQQSMVMPARDLKTEISTLESLGHVDVDVLKEDLEIGLGEVDVVADDSASETDNFMDAVTTMDSEVETDSEVKARGFMDAVATVDSEVDTDSEVKARGFMDAVATVDSEVDTDSEVKARGFMDAVVTVDSEVETDSEVKARDFMDAVPTVDSEVDTDSEVKARDFMDAVPTVDSEVETDSEVTARGFMDAVTIVDSEVETDSEVKARGEVDDEFLVELEEVEGPVAVNLPISEHASGADEENIAIEEDKGHLVVEEDKERLFIEVDTSSGDHTPEESFRTEHALHIDTASTVCAEEEDSCSVDGDVARTSGQDNDVGTSGHDNDASTPNSRSGVSLFGLGEDAVAKSEWYFVDKAPTNDASTRNSQIGASLNGLGEDVAKSEEDGVAKSERYFVDKGPANLAEQLDSSSVDKSVVAPSIQDNDVSASTSQRGALFPSLEDAVSNSEGCLQYGSTNLVLETPETSEANTNDNFFVEKLTADFNQLPDVLEKDLPHSESLKALGALTTRKRWQISKLFIKECLSSDLERNSPQASESEQTESPKKPSSHSSPSSSLQPMSWPMDLSRSHHTDDEMDGMQVSSVSPSSSSSTVSTPRPSTLATTLLNVSLESKQRSPLSPQKSVDSSARSLLSSSSVIDTVPCQPVLLVKTTAESLVSPDSECSADSSPQSSSSTVEPFFDSLPSSGLDINTSTSENLAENFSVQSLAEENLEIFPPPPPLPPLAWRTTRSHSNLVYPSKPKESPSSIPNPRDIGLLPDELSQGFTSSPTVLTVPCASVIKLNELTQACNSPTAVQLMAQKVETMPDESLQSFTHATGPSVFQTSHGSCDLLQVSKPAESHKRAPLSFTSNADTVEQGTVSVLAPLDLKGDNLVTAIPDRSLQEKFIVGSTRAFSPRVLRTESTPARLDESRLGLQTQTAVEYGRQDSPSAIASNFERKDFYVQATTSHDRLKERSKWALTSSTASSDDREVLLEQIRTRSFNLRHTSAEKPAAPRPVTNINVAAILEKANAIRQAFAGSDEDDEDDEWSDA